MQFPRLRLCLLLGGFSLALTIAHARTANRVLIVVNRKSDVSLKAGLYYMGQRAIPAENIVFLECPDNETVGRVTFDRTIRVPIARHLIHHRLVDQILYIVTTKGVPLKIEGSGGGLAEALQASVDSELTLLYWEIKHRRSSRLLRGALHNPYFNADPEMKGEAHFNHKRWPIYLVTRLTGYTLEDIKGLVNRGLRARGRGLFVIDTRKPPGHPWLLETASRLSQMGCEVLLDQTTDVVRGQQDVLGYVSWGSNDPKRTDRRLGFSWVPGALAAPLVSTSARTFIEPPHWWRLGRWDDRGSFWRGSPQSLLGDLIAEGVTGAVGYVWEPMLQAVARPQILFPAYAAGYNLAESCYMALPHLSWQAVVVGDPLCAPFAHQPAYPAIAH